MGDRCLGSDLFESAEGLTHTHIDQTIFRTNVSIKKIISVNSKGLKIMAASGSKTAAPGLVQHVIPFFVFLSPSVT